MFNNLSTREKILLTIAFILIVSAVYYFYFYQPLVEEIANLEREKEQKSARLETAISFAKKLPEIKEEYEMLVADLRERGVYLNKDVIDLLIDFREAARENNLELTFYKPNPVEDGISMNVVIDGGFREVSNLFEDFQDWNYWFEFQGMDIQRNGDGVTVDMNVMYHDQMVDLEGVEADV